MRAERKIALSYSVYLRAFDGFLGEFPVVYDGFLIVFRCVLIVLYV